MSIMTVKDLKKKAPKGEFLAYINKEEAAALKRAGGSGHLVNGIPSFVGSDYSGKGDANTSGYQGGNRGTGGYQGSKGGINSTSNTGNDGNFNPNVTAKGTTITTGDLSSALQTYNHNIVTNQAYKNPYGPVPYNTKEKKLQNFYNTRPKVNLTKKLQFLQNPLQKFSDFTTEKNRSFFEDVIRAGKVPGLDFGTVSNMTEDELETAYQDYMSDRLSGATDAYGNPNLNYNDNNNNNQSFIPIDYNTGAATAATIEDAEPYNQFTYRMGDPAEAADVTRASYNFNQGGRAGKAEGGIMGLRARRAFGGIMDRVTGRRAYGLGSIFKGVKKAVSGVVDATKKVLKSDIGKAALLYAGGAYLGGSTMMGGAGRSFMSRMASPSNLMNLLKNTKGRGLFDLASRAGGSLFGEDSVLKKAGESMVGKKNDGIMDNVVRFGKYLAPAYLLSKTKLGEAPPNELDLMTARANNKLVDPLTGQKSDPASMTATLNEALENAQGDPDKIAEINKAYRFLNDPRLGDDGAKSVLVANGGRIRRAEGGLMDLGGMEKDYRAEGGFVPIGEYEKKDDVPARLSVNEFVFTADAVRGAGQGDIDKGAEIMENMMENLENGGTVSEESQGNKGAQQMFETSQRLGEVV